MKTTVLNAPKTAETLLINVTVDLDSNFKEENVLKPLSPFSTPSEPKKNKKPDVCPPTS